MAIQLLMRKDGVEFDLIDVGTLALPHGTLTELLVQLRKTIDITKSIQQKGAILYQKFDKPPDRYSADFPKLLKIRYENEAHPLRWFLLQLSLPTLLKVSHDHTIKCLEDNEEHLKCFAEYAESNTELKQNFVDRAMKVLTKDCRDRFNRDYLDYQGDIISLPLLPCSLLTLLPSQTSLLDHSRVAAIFEQPAASEDCTSSRLPTRRSAWQQPAAGRFTLKRSVVADRS